MILTKLKIAAATFATATLISGAAHAALCSASDTGNAVGDTSGMVLTSIMSDSGTTAVSQEASDCGGVFNGNDTGAMGTLISKINGGLFGLVADPTDPWTVYGKSDDGDSTVTADNGSTTGDWMVDFGLPSNVTAFIMTLKVGNFYTAFYFDEFDPAGFKFSGTFSSQLAGLVNRNGDGQALSHSTAVLIKRSDMPIVPLPATLPLLAAGLAGFGLLRRRKTS